MTEYTSKDVARFWAKVDCTAGLFECWLWTACTANGYGAIYWHGHQRGAHCISYELAHGPIPDSLLVCHTCDNKLCCNPSHLFLGTNLDNAQDKERKGRGNQVYGENSGSCKLSDVQVIEIRRLHAAGNVTLAELGRMFNVSYVHIGKIVRHEKRKRPTLF